MKKTKRLFIILLMLTLVLMSFSFAFATSEIDRYTDISGDKLLAESDAEALNEYLEKLSDASVFDITIHVMEEGLDDETLMYYADDYYDVAGYGYGERYDGCILVVDLEEGSWWISTCGFGETAITDFGIENLNSTLYSYFSEGDFLEGFMAFADRVAEFVAMADEGTPYDGPATGERPEPGETPFNAGAKAGSSVVIGALVGLLSSGRKKGKLTSVHNETRANNYTRPGSMNVTGGRDVFLYRNVTATAKPKNNNSGGGSTTHRSSSGRSHGGGGGHF